MALLCIALGLSKEEAVGFSLDEGGELALKAAALLGFGVDAAKEQAHLGGLQETHVRVRRLADGGVGRKPSGGGGV